MTRTLDPSLEHAISLGLITRGLAEDADAFGDGLASAVASGEMTLEQALAQAELRGESDGEAVRRARERATVDPIVQALEEVGHEMGLAALAMGFVPDETTIGEAVDAALARIATARAKPLPPRRPVLPRLELGPHGPAWLSLLALCGWMAGVVEWDGVEPFRGVGGE